MDFKRSLFLFYALLVSSAALAISPTWTGATSSTWFSNGNWTSPATAPANSVDTAIFAGTVANTLAQTNSASFSLGGVQFNAGAAAYTVVFGVGTNISLVGTGVVNNSSNTQLFRAAGPVNFRNSVDAGSNVVYSNLNANAALLFFDTATATNAIMDIQQGRLDISGLTAAGLTIGGLTNTTASASSVVLGNKSLTVGAANTSGLYNGIISGTGSLTKTGTGTLTLGSASTYTGGTTISGGGLQLGNGSTTGMVLGDIVDNGTLIFNRSNNLIYTNSISGSGGFSKLNNNILTLAGTNTYTGNTLISAGTLQLGNGGTTGIVGGDIVNNASLVLNQTNAVTYANVISGTGVLTKSGFNTLTLTADNTYTGNTTISTGTLQLGSGGTTGSINFTPNIINNGALVFDRSDILTYPGVISGIGTVTQMGAGTLVLTGNNTYTGNTTISAGTLQIGNAGTTGSLVSNITNNGALIFDRSDTMTYGGVISGSGSLTQAGAGKIILTNANTYAGNTLISAGTLQLGDGNTTGSIDLTANITNNGSFIFNHSNVLTDSGIMSGTGSLTQLGTGTVVLTGADVYTGGTTISAGSLQIGNGGTVGSVVGDITDNAALVFNHSDTVAYGNVVSGTGSLAQIGSGTLVLTGENLYSGGTIVSAGELQIGGGGTVGSIVGDIVNEALVTFNRSDAFTYEGVISGAGGVTKLNNNTLILTGNNTYTGTTQVSTGTLQIGDGGTSGSLLGNVMNGTTVNFNRANNSIYPGVIDGIGAVTKSGVGTLVFTGNNTYTGGTTIFPGEGTLQIGNEGVTGSIVGDVLDDSSLAFNRSDTLTYSGVISGGGSVTQLGAGTLILTNTNTYTGGSTISAGTLQIGDGGTAGSVTGNITDNATLTWDRSDSVVYAGMISGSGGVNKQGVGTLVFTGDNNYLGSTFVSTGTLEIGNGGTTGSVLGNITNNDTVIFNRSDAVTYGGIITGSGSVTKLGTDSLILIGDNTYTGATLISAGNLQVGNGGATGSVRGDIIDNGLLTFNRSNGVIYDSSISGTGALIQSGPGALTLNGINTYLGDTNIDGGVLILGDSSHAFATIAGNVNVNPGATLHGFGTVGGNIMNNGIVSPGTSIGTLTVNGNYTETPTSFYEAEVDAQGRSDLLKVTGTATLAGTISVDAILGGFVKFYNYTVITATGGVVGQFANVDLDGIFTQGFLMGQVFYLPNAVEFRVDFNPDAFIGAAQTPNQKAVADYLFKTDATPAIQGLLAMINTDQQFQEAMDQISGATYANQTLEIAHIGNWFEDRMSDRFDQFPACTNYPILHKKLKEKNHENCNTQKAWWGAVYDGRDQLEAGAVSGLNTDTTGLAVGYENPLSDQTGVGVAAGYNHFRSYATGQEMGNDRGDLFQLGVYGHYEKGPWLLGAAIDAGVADHVNAERQIQAGMAGIAETTSTYSAYLFSAQMRMGYKIDIKPQFTVRPFLGVIAQEVERSGFTEQGDSGFTLDVSDASYYSLRSQLGIMMLEAPVSVVKPFALLAWEHEFGDNESNFNAKLSALTSNETFHIEGTELGSDVALLEAGVVLLQKKTWGLSAFYEGRFANSWQENSATLQLNVRL